MDVIVSFMREYSKFLIRPNPKFIFLPPIVLLLIIEVIFFQQVTAGGSNIAGVIAIFFVFLAITAPFSMPKNIDRHSKYIRPYIYVIPFGLIMYYIVIILDEWIQLNWTS